MVTSPHLHSQTEWLEARLDEIDDSIAHFETSVKYVTSNTRSKADAAMEDMRQRRDSFKQWVDQKEDQGEQTWLANKTKFEKEWDFFEESVETFLEATQDKAKASADIFKARAASQKLAWDKTVGRLKKSADKFNDRRKADVDKATATLKAETDKAGDTLKGINAAGHESWPALRKALSKSRNAFDDALADTKAAFKRAEKD
ncbi:hypothetical protein GCM10009069_29730 [Algimonas arctica]|uniref:Uncharacterized protein n=1 Tax=Algimonas arctica TaxID=1479486 RepID=A0A8J3CV01_9PROT|nr:hypothetical protein [Algimonas arctica]GHB05321.1 hypothetical protein GCM10009069_29730 [Algimonas arctica]